MDKPIFPFDLTKSTDKLKKLIAEHPDYPIVVLVDGDLPTADYNWTYAASISFSVGEILDCPCPYDEEYVCTDRDEFEERLEDWLWDEMCDEDNAGDGVEPSEEQFQERLNQEKAQYEPYWKKVIAIYAGT